MAAAVVNLAQSGFKPGNYDNLLDVRAAYKGFLCAQLSDIARQFLDTKDPSTVQLRSHGTSMEPPSTEAKDAIMRIMQCDNEAHAAILGVPESAPKDEVLAAWRKLGCLVQPHMANKDAGDTMISNKESFFWCGASC
jgi:hypothetical protein